MSSEINKIEEAKRAKWFLVQAIDEALCARTQLQILVDVGAMDSKTIVDMQAIISSLEEMKCCVCNFIYHEKNLG